MIRHSRSFLISIIIHSVLLLLVLFAWNNYSVIKKADCDKKIHLSICDVVTVKELTKAKEPPKKENQKPQKPQETPKKEMQKPKKIEKIEKTAEIKPAPIPEKKVVLEPEVQEPKIIEKPAVFEEVVVLQEAVQEKNVETQQETPKLKQEKSSKEYLKVNTQKIAKLLQENLYYPRSARKKNITGEIVVKFTLGIDAKVYDIKIVESKSEILSRAAIKTIEDLSGVFPAPEQELILHVPINYDLKH